MDIQGTTREKIAALTAKAHRQTWSPDDIFNGTAGISIPALVPRRLYAALISQFLHGEIATAQLCRNLIKVIDDPVVCQFLATQADDEDRHARAYGQYLDRIGGPSPIDPLLQAAFETVLTWDGPPQASILGFHILIEGEALRTLSDFQSEWPCPVFKKLNTRISRDEARHVAFGKLFLTDTLAALPAAEQQLIFLRLRNLWDQVGDGILSGIRIPRFFTRHLRRRWLAEGWEYHRRNFADVGLLNMTEMRRIEWRAA